jgi:hypothetical protein
MVPMYKERIRGLDLLRACRQIYSETALLPYTENTFSFRSFSSAKDNMQRLKTFQLSAVTRVQFEVTHRIGPRLSDKIHETCRTFGYWAQT